MADPMVGNLRRLTVSNPFSKAYLRSQRKMNFELERLILSASGWRKVFARSDEDRSPEISDTDREIVAAAAKVFGDLLHERQTAERAPEATSAATRPTVALATDTRPTGASISSAIARVLLSAGVEVRYLGVAAAPEIMAYVRQARLSGFVFVSASHNPIGHNGLKFGLSGGSVIGAADAHALIKAFKLLIADPTQCKRVIGAAAAVADDRVAALEHESGRFKEEALAAYLAFTLEVGTMSADPAGQEEVVAPLREALRSRRTGILADFNGSARSLSIDAEMMERLGVRFRSINDRPGEVVHTIVPEGEALEPCRRELEALYAQDHGFLLGYVPDNDGDRGNIVYVDPHTGRAETLKAQEVFALSCVAELAYLVYSGRLSYWQNGRAQQRHAVVVNGPTSLRVEAIAKAFDVRVFRCEVGEANVVNLARDSIDSGFRVRIMGEGSNGGNITYPARVRDPLNTLFAFLKLLVIGSKPNRPGLYEIWCRRSGHPYDPRAGLREMLDSLPRFVTTDVNDPRAMVDIETKDHLRLKEAYEELFLREWEEHREMLAARLGVHTWEEINYERTVEIHGFGRSYRSGKQRGGLKILFKDDSGRPVAFMWMRGSGTEPVFRIMADVMGTDEELEQSLLAWHASMVRRAAEKVQTLISVES